MRFFIGWLSLSLTGILYGSQASVYASSVPLKSQPSNSSASFDYSAEGKVERAATRCANLKHLVPTLIKETTIEVYVSELHGPGNFSDPDSKTIGYRAVVINLPRFCRFGGHFNTSSISQVQFEVWLPVEDWSGRFAFVGNGGGAGGVNFPDMGIPLSKYKFAVVSTNAGHNGTVNDGLFAISNPESQNDFGYRAVHLSTVFSKVVVQTFYAKAAKKSYWIGCSSGGKQGLKEVQAFPEDFDGVLAGAAAQWWTHLNAWSVESNLRNLRTMDGFMNASDWNLIHEQILNECDLLDGVKDRIINNPLVCKPTFDSLRCSQDEPQKSSSTHAIASCLTSQQISVAQSAFEDMVDEDGTFLFPAFTYGSETFGPMGMFMNEVALQLAMDFFKYQVLNFTSINTEYKFTSRSLLEMISVADKTNPGQANAIDGNILPFIKRGGKLMTYTGMADPLIPSRSSIWYHEQVKKTLGRDPRESYRLFPVPGMGHCRGGPGPSNIGAAEQKELPLNSTLQSSSFLPEDDMILALIDWTENGNAPDHIIATKFVNDLKSEGIQFQRKLCPWPLVAKYDGHGDSNSHHSYHCKDQ
ncbi:Tannase/feruloyl esterase [Melampsora americana]|nr:Tannase/feruloyl esterase [Melampsora americana]